MDSDDKKITQLSRVTSLSDSDLLVVVVDIGTAPVTKAIEKSNAITGGASKLVQRVEGTPNTTYSSITTAMPVDDTIPQNTEGGEVCTVTITPTSATNRLVIRAQFSGTSDTALLTVIALFQDSIANALAVGYQISTANGLMMVHLYYEMAAGTTSATTFKLRAGNNAGSTTYVNGTSAGRKFGGVSACRISVDEIKV